ncbi:DHHW family protein [Clostridium sp. B9]|uniref:DHHW family protein n=1 Tax=Clostridium sp. B9 TaxID=3423224 RepID=UPI003D2F0AA0
MKKNPIVYVFAFILILIFLFDILEPKKSFSEIENRNLAQKPKLSIKSLEDGSYTKNFEAYINDNFLLRDDWISLKSISEYVLGKIENNNIIYGENGYMFDKIDSYDEKRFKKNLEALNMFIDKFDGRVTTMIVPNSYVIYGEYLPLGANLLNQKKIINEIYKSTSKDKNIDLVELFSKHKDEYIYYKTDHHWTTKGAYLAYSEYMSSIGEVPIDLNEFKKNEVNDFYGTYFSKAKAFNAESDVITYYDIENITMDIQGEKYNSLYDYEKLNARDKYSVFIRGNNGLTIIKNNEIENGKKLIVFKDSFANSMIPFLSQNFEEIHVIDLRSFSMKVSEYVKNTKIEEVLILYNTESFLDEVNIVRLKY